jgi:hypothetical protein
MAGRAAVFLVRSFPEFFIRCLSVVSQDTDAFFDAYHEPRKIRAHRAAKPADP